MKKNKITNIKKEKNNPKVVNNRQINWKVVIFSLLALLCLVLVYYWDWIFIFPAVYFVYLNQKEIFRK